MSLRAYVVHLIVFILLPYVCRAETQYRVEHHGEVIGVYATQAEAQRAIDDRINQERNRYRQRVPYDELTKAAESAAVENLSASLKINAVTVDTPAQAMASQGRSASRPRHPEGNLNKRDNAVRNLRIIKQRAHKEAQRREREARLRRENRAERAYDNTMTSTQGIVNALSARAAYAASPEAAEYICEMMDAQSQTAVRGITSLNSHRNVQINIQRYANYHEIPDSFFIGKPFRSLDLREGGTGQLRSSSMDMPYLYPYPISVAYSTNSFWNSMRDNIYVQRFCNSSLGLLLDKGFKAVSNTVDYGIEKMKETGIGLLSFTGIENAQRIVTNLNASAEFSVGTIAEVLVKDDPKIIVDAVSGDRAFAYTEKTISNTLNRAGDMVNSADFGPGTGKRVKVYKSGREMVKSAEYDLVRQAGGNQLLKKVKRAEAVESYIEKFSGKSVRIGIYYKENPEK